MSGKSSENFLCTFNLHPVLGVSSCLQLLLPLFQPDKQFSTNERHVGRIQSVVIHLRRIIFRKWQTGKRR